LTRISDENVAVSGIVERSDFYEAKICKDKRKSGIIETISVFF
jgi:hypothetical protein